MPTPLKLRFSGAPSAAAPVCALLLGKIKRDSHFLLMSSADAGKVHSKRPSVAEIDSAEDASSDVASHYDKKRAKSVVERQRSKAIQLFSFNNWIKAVLINEHVAPHAKVLDLCCGKGGDLTKWKKRCVSLVVGADISNVSIDQCIDRFESMPPGRSFDAHFFTADCFAVSKRPNFVVVFYVLLVFFCARDRKTLQFPNE